MGFDCISLVHVEIHEHLSAIHCKQNPVIIIISTLLAERQSLGSRNSTDGTKMSLSFANIFAAKIETEIINHCTKKQKSARKYHPF